MEDGLEEDNWHYSEDHHVKKFQEYKEVVDQKTLNILSHFIFGLDTLIPPENNNSLHYFLEYITDADIQLPNYEKTVALIRQNQENNTFQHIPIDNLAFDELPTEIVYTEEEKQQRAEAKVRQEFESKYPKLEKHFKIGLLNYAFSLVLNHLGKKYHFLNKVVNMIWEYLITPNQDLKEQIGELLTWIIISENHQNHPLIDSKDKIYIRLLRKKYPQYLFLYKEISRELGYVSHWYFHNTEDNDVLGLSETDKALQIINEIISNPLPIFSDLLEIIMQKANQEDKIVLDYAFFNNLVKNTNQ